MPTAFVLMPFSSQFDDLYAGFIKPALEGEGFEVKRADDIQSTQNILKDIFEGIASSDLIVADLTESNPNVFYELGIAHSFRKPTILLTQSIEEAPFDLRAYRLIPYSRDFAEIEKSRQQLVDLARAFKEGKLPVGSPIADFYPLEHAPATTYSVVDKPEYTTDMDTDVPGLVDYQLQFQEFIESIGPVVNRVTDAIRDMGYDLQNSADQLEEIGKTPNESSAKAIQNVCRRLANKLGTFNGVMRPSNIEFSETTSKLSEILESMIALQVSEFDLYRAEILELILQETSPFLGEFDAASETCLSLAEQMEALPRLERRLHRELEAGTHELRKMADNITGFSMLFRSGE